MNWTSFVVSCHMDEYWSVLRDFGVVWYIETAVKTIRQVRLNHIYI
jgi:hypothetical protein